VIRPDRRHTSNRTDTQTRTSNRSQRQVEEPQRDARMVARAMIPKPGFTFRGLRGRPSRHGCHPLGSPTYLMSIFGPKRSVAATQATRVSLLSKSRLTGDGRWQVPRLPLIPGGRAGREPSAFGRVERSRSPERNLSMGLAAHSSDGALRRYSRTTRLSRRHTQSCGPRRFGRWRRHHRRRRQYRRAPDDPFRAIRSPRKSVGKTSPEADVRHRWHRTEFQRTGLCRRLRPSEPLIHARATAACVIARSGDRDARVHGHEATTATSLSGRFTVAKAAFPWTASTFTFADNPLEPGCS